MWIHLLTLELIRGAGGGYNTWWDNGFWADAQRKMWSWKPKKKEILAALEDSPNEVIQALPEVQQKIRQEYGEIDYSKVINNAKMQEFIVKQVIIALQLRKSQLDEEDAEILLLMD